MLAACTEWGLAFFCFSLGGGTGGVGGCVWSPLSVLSSVFPLFSRFSSSSFWRDGSILDGNSQTAVKAKVAKSVELYFPLHSDFCVLPFLHQTC